MNEEGIVGLFEANLNEVLENIQTLFDEWESMSQPTRSVSVMAVLSRMGELVSDCEDVIKIIENSFPPIRLTADENWRERINNVHLMINGLFTEYSKGNVKDINALFTSLSASEHVIITFDKVVNTEKDMLDTLTSVFSHLYDLLVALRETLDGDRSTVYAELYATAEARYAKEVWRDNEETGEWHKFTKHLRNTVFPWDLEPTFEQLQDLYKEEADKFTNTRAGAIWEEHKEDPMALGKAIAENNLTNEELTEFFRQSYRLMEIEKLAKKKRIASDIGERSKIRNQGKKRGPHEQYLFIDGKATKENICVKNQEKKRFMQYMKDHNLSSRTLNCTKDDTVNDILTCFILHWIDRGLTAKSPSGGAIYRFMTDDCGFKSEVLPNAYSNEIKERLKKRTYDLKNYKSVALFIKNN